MDVKARPRDISPKGLEVKSVVNERIRREPGKIIQGNNVEGGKFTR